MKLISADLSQIEMRTMAFLSREPNMLAVYKDGLYDGDMHNYMAGQLAKRRGLDTWTPEDRQLAKPLNFALLYGAEWFTVQSYLLQEYGIIMSQKDIKHIRDDIFFGSAFPGLPEYFNKVIRQAQLDGGVEGTFGLRRQLPNINVRDISLRTAAAREAINTDNQGLASYLALIGCFLLDKEAGSVVEQVAFIHDATLALVREVDVDIASRLIKRIFEKQIREYVASVFGIDFDVPIKIDIKVGASWGDN
jgi:DNA polymerase-1